jgi:hypothetical protein
MKKIMLSIFILSLSIVSAQSFNAIYMGNDFNFYKGSKLTLDTNSYSLHYMFYDKLDKIKDLFPQGVYSPDETYDFSTKKESLLGKIFRVDSIIEDKSLRRCIFELVENSTNETIYFIYDIKRCSSKAGFPFLTSKEFKKEDFCSSIKIKKDDFTDKVNFDAPWEKDGLARYQISKVISANSKSYYLYITTTGSTPNVGIKGVILLLDDKSKINKPDVTVDIKVDGSNYEYSALIPLTEQEMNLLKTKSIDKYRLYIYDQDLSYGASEKLKMYIQCITDMN